MRYNINGLQSYKKFFKFTNIICFCQHFCAKQGVYTFIFPPMRIIASHHLAGSSQWKKTIAVLHLPIR